VRRLAGWIGGGLAVVIFVVAVAGWLLLRHYNGNIDRVALPAVGQGAAPKGQQAHSENFLLVGSDTRMGVGKGFGNSKVISGARADTTILAHLPAHGRPTLVSFPRDSYVEIPAYRSHGTAHAAQMNKLNAAYSLGGPELLIRTIHELTGLRIDHYVEINFKGFERMVDSLGGITLCVGTTRHDPIIHTATGWQGSGDLLTAGTHHVDGKQALAFVRDRHSFPDEDISRIRDQQYFIAQMVKKVESAGTLFNPLKLNAFLNALTSSIRTDKGLSLNDLRDLAFRLRHIDPKHVRFITVPFVTSNYLTPAGDAVELDHAKDTRLFGELSGSVTVRPGHHPHHQVKSNPVDCGA